MNFNDKPEDAAFRAEVRRWLAANAPKASRQSATRNDPRTPAAIERAKRWQTRKYDAGYAAISWPAEYGGRAGTALQELIYRQEEAAYAVDSAVFAVGVEMCLPVVRIFGSPAQKERYITPALRGREIWCQLFSEPAAGSDLAGIRTRAAREQDGWAVNGQKVWTSGAHYSDFGILLARTDPKAPKHKGLTMFVLDMKAPGVTVRPIRNMTGMSEFNEVFLDDVRIPDAQRLGDEGSGWKVALATLMFERHSVGTGVGFLDYADILRLARVTKLGDRPAIEDGRVRERLVDMYLNSRGLTLLGYRAQTSLAKGAMPGPEQSIRKLVAASQSQQASYFAMDLAGQAGMLLASEHGPAWAPVEYSWMHSAALRIAGGADEILTNIIAERVLGLPQDARPDKNIPFDELPR